MNSEEMIECCVRIEKASKEIDALCVKLLELNKPIDSEDDKE
jgi:uncharacterized coiled-coil DUF342 family protein